MQDAKRKKNSTKGGETNFFIPNKISQFPIHISQPSSSPLQPAPHTAAVPCGRPSLEPATHWPPHVQLLSSAALLAASECIPMQLQLQRYRLINQPLLARLLGFILSRSHWALVVALFVMCSLAHGGGLSLPSAPKRFAGIAVIKQSYFILAKRRHVL